MPTRPGTQGDGGEAKLCYCGNVLMENRNGVIVDAELSQANGAIMRVLDRKGRRTDAAVTAAIKRGTAEIP